MWGLSLIPYKFKSHSPQGKPMENREISLEAAPTIVPEPASASQGLLVSTWVAPWPSPRSASLQGISHLFPPQALAGCSAWGVLCCHWLSVRGTLPPQSRKASAPCLAHCCQSPAAPRGARDIHPGSEGHRIAGARHVLPAPMVHCSEQI